MRVLITQLAADASGLVAALKARGHQGVSVPLLTAERALPPKINLAGAQGFLVTSAEGARALADHVGVRTFPVFTDSAVTTAELRRLGFMEIETAKDDSADLARLIERKLTPANGALIYACSTVAPINLPTMLSNMGFAVRPMPLYTLKRVATIPAELEAALRARAVDAALFLTADEARAFVALVQKSGMEPLVASLATVAATPVVAAPLRALKLGGVSVPAGADLETVFGALDVKLVDRVEEERAARETSRREEAERQRAEHERLELERAERERLASEQTEIVRAAAAAARAEAERDREARRRTELARAAEESVQSERAARERAEREGLEQERLASEKAERERIAGEKAIRAELERARAADAAMAEKAERGRIERDRQAKERAERGRLAQEKIALAKTEQERIVLERAEYDRLEGERLAVENAERERIARDIAETERIERERVAQERAELDRLEQERLFEERADREHIAAERAAARKVENDRLAGRVPNRNACRARNSRAKRPSACGLPPRRPAERSLSGRGRPKRRWQRRPNVRESNAKARPKNAASAVAWLRKKSHWRKRNRSALSSSVRSTTA